MITITIEREAPDALRKEKYHFYLDTHRWHLRLTEYTVLTRAELRHKYQPTETYRTGIRRRESTLAAVAVPLPDDVAAEALQVLVERVKVVR